MGFVGFAGALLIASAGAETSDWPMWGCDAARSSVTAHELPERLELRWVRALPPARPAWPGSQPKLQYDAWPQPIAIGTTLIVGSTVNDSVTAYHTETGDELWRFYTGGPVRFAPVAGAGRVYAASDDGYLYCLDLASGAMLWRVAGGPEDRLVVGNERLVSTWPIRGGPVLKEGVVYFTAGIWPFMGIFIHAVDAQTGEHRWLNSDTGSEWVVHPHNAPSFGSIVPQGYLAVSGESVIVPGGRSLPAVFDRRTGRLQHFQFGGKQSGGWSVAANDLFYVVGDEAFALAGGAALGRLPVSIVTPDFIAGDGLVTKIGRAIREVETVDRTGKKHIEQRVAAEDSFRAAPKGWEMHLVAGRRVFASAGHRIAAFPVDRAGDGDGVPVWSAECEAPAGTMIAADKRLFVVDTESRVYCFADSDAPLIRHAREQGPPAAAPMELAAAVLAESSDYGYAVVIGLNDERLVEGLVAQSKLHIVVVDPREEVVHRFRRRMDAAGLYGTRVAALAGSYQHLELPPYLARLVVCDPQLVADSQAIERVYRSLRPYGGAAMWILNGAGDEPAAIARTSLPQAQVRRAGPLTVLARVGPLPGAGSWTHQYGNSANTGASDDELVKGPLGLLWFGGPSNDEILPRHGHGPTPQVAGGRIVIEGPDLLRCLDVYSGSLLWERRLPGLGKYYDTVRHFPGAGEIGSNYVTLEDAIYVVYGNELLVLDPDSGRTQRAFAAAEAAADPGAWGFLAVSGDLLVATRAPVRLSAADPNDPPPKSLVAALETADYSAASRELIAFDRHSGQRLWSRTATHSFRHNTIVAAAGLVFCIDGMTAPTVDVLRRRGIAAAPSRLLALDARTGQERWSTGDRVFGTFLNYSARHDLLIEAGSAYRDRAADEIDTGIVARAGATGDLVWERRDQKHAGPCLLLGDQIITNGAEGFDLDLRTGDRSGWTYRRMYGCNTVIGSPNLLTFRSGAAGFCDLAGDSGTGNIGGFRSSCTSNLIIADGVLSAPDYTRTCSCAYQNQSSLALVHMPEAEMWTFSNLDEAPGEFGINLGAPGDRRDEHGLLWFDVPGMGGRSPELHVRVEGPSVRSVRHHHSRIEQAGQMPAWVAASCVVGVSAIVRPVAEEPARYRVRLCFAELEQARAGERIFDVAVQGRTVIESLDVAAEAGGAFRSVVREFSGIEASGSITISFHPRAGSPCLSGVAIMAEPESGAGETALPPRK